MVQGNRDGAVHSGERRCTDGVHVAAGVVVGYAVAAVCQWARYSRTGRHVDERCGGRTWIGSADRDPAVQCSAAPAPAAGPTVRFSSGFFLLLLFLFFYWLLLWSFLDTHNTIHCHRVQDN